MPRPPAGHISRKCAGKRTNGQPCRAWAQHTSDYCVACERRRRGQFKPGPLAPNYKHGIYAKVVPARLLQAYQEGLRDPELLSGKDEVALLRSRLTELIERVDTGESDTAWDLLHAAKYEFELNVSQPDPTAKAKAQKALNTIMELIDTGHTQRLAWADVERLTALLDKLKISERRRLMELKAYVTITDMLTVLQTIKLNLQKVVPQEVADKESQQRIFDAMATAVEQMLAMNGKKNAA